MHQPILILAHFKEVSFFFGFFDRSSAVRTASVFNLCFGPERFAGGTIPAFIFAFIDITLIVKLFKYLFNNRFMIVISSTDKFIIADIQISIILFNAVCDLIGVFLRFNMILFCQFLYFLTVLVGAGQHKYIIPDQSMISRNCIGENNFIIISGMRFSGSIGDCSGDIKFLCHFKHPFSVE